MAAPARIRPLARIIFAVALVGILVVTHLGLQVEKGFADGCTGFGADITAEALGAAPEAGCASVATGDYADFMGVSNIVWGLLFYGLIALLRLGYGITGDDRFRLASLGAVIFGFGYTLYLIYLQAFVIESFCILCMTSAAIVTTLLILHVLEHRKLAQGIRHSAPPPSRSEALRPYAVLAGLFAVLLVADVALAGGEAPEAVADAAASGETPDTRVDAPASLAPPLPAGCAYDPQFAPIGDLSAFTNNPSKGTGPVTVIDVFDPNCPHCRALHEEMAPVVAANLDKATFYYVPFPLKPPSVGQAAAFVLAQREGKFFELMDAFFERQDNTWGMTIDELRDTANSVGLDGPSLIATLQDEGEFESIRQQIQANSDAVQRAFAAPGGGISVPKLAVNGRIVAPTEESYSAECLNQFIADASAPADAPPAVVAPPAATE